ncbi:MAG: HopJ type III effector protein [Porticoccaceae bacterium]|nr:HopJ type III effector protein [Porticoccaceae bacterium]
MTPKELIQSIKNNPQTVEFNDVISVIDSHYTYTETRFSNGLGDKILINEAGSNAGSCRIFAFAQLNNLSEAETLACFGRYYREDVLGNPGGQDHSNIRTFIRDGWAGIHFDSKPLLAR